LKRTTASAAVKVYEPFLERFPDLARLSEASFTDLETLFSPLGLHKQRAKSTAAMTVYLSSDYSSEIPAGLCELLKIPGIGQYSSRAVLSFGFDRPFAVVDGNVQRILGRVYGSEIVSGSTVTQHQQIVDRLLPIKRHREFNYALIDIGSMVCRPSMPKCGDCPLLEVCDYHNGLSNHTKQSLPPQALFIKQTRERRKMSLVTLSELSGVSKPTIANIEKGRTNPKAKTVEKVLRALT
jgi:A/G-specific adenine glycosylase